MKTFIVIYHAPIDVMQQMAGSTEEERNQSMAAWMEWAKKCGDRMVDLGKPLFGGTTISSDGSSTESNKQVCGYSILKASNLEEAKTLLEDHPHLSWDSRFTIDVHEGIDMQE